LELISLVNSLLHGNKEGETHLELAKKYYYFAQLRCDLALCVSP